MLFRGVFQLSLCPLTILLILTALTGDYLVKISKSQLQKACLDNITHASIGAISWLIASISKMQPLRYSIKEALLCAALASIIDLDHFFAAKSMNIKDAVNLHQRPPLHSSTLPFSLSFVLYLLGFFWQKKTWSKISLIIFTAFLSHHTRDATRRGYWFAPFGSTSPIPYPIYISFTVIIAFLIRFCINLNSVDMYIPLQEIV